MSTTSSTVRYLLVKGFPGYCVGDDGSVWSCKVQGHANLYRQKWKKLSPGRYCKSGHVHVNLSINGKRTFFAVHRLILETFVGPCPPGMQCCHSPDRNPKNNRLDNLRWDTPKANSEDAVRDGTIIACRGQTNGNSKLTNEQVWEIRRLYATGKWQQRPLAKKFKVSQTLVGMIVRREVWWHI